MRYWPADYFVYRWARGRPRPRTVPQRPSLLAWFIVAVVITVVFLPIAVVCWSVWFLEVFPAAVLGMTSIFVILGVSESLLVKRRR